MSRLIRSELIKLRSTRTFLGIVVAALGIVLLVALAIGIFESPDGPAADAEPVDAEVISLASIVQYFALVIGVLAVSTEFRHGTITPSLLVAPRRAKLLSAKLISHTVAGAALGLAAVAIALLVMGGLFAARGFDTDFFTGEGARIVAGSVLVCALMAAIGVGLGALVRNQVGGIIIGLAFIFMIEPLLTLVPGVREWAQNYSLGVAAEALSGAPITEGAEKLTQLEGGLLMLGYTFLIVVAGFLVFRRRDITA